MSESTQGTTAIEIIDQDTLRDRIHVIRGQKVMLDFDLAEIYGYTTKAFNQQVKNNREKFEEDFIFRLTDDETSELSRSIFLTLNKSGRGSNLKYNPYAFTEQGIYMLMTVLKGELATRQSKALIRLFKRMKDHAIESQGLVDYRDLLLLSMQTAENADAIRKVESILANHQKTFIEQRKILQEHDDVIAIALEGLSETVKKSEISPVLLEFDLPENAREFLLLNGRPAKASLTYMHIYEQARKSVYVIDNYISLKTLYLLKDVRPGVQVMVFSDNLGNGLHASDYSDFQTEFPDIPMTFVTTAGTVHDRFIVLDYGEPSERLFHCGTSSKDAALKRTTAISEMTSADVKSLFRMLMDQMRGNPPLELR